MAKKDKELIKVLRSCGVRKKLARELGIEASNGKPSKKLVRSTQNLRSATSVLEERVRQAQREDAGKKAAWNRKATLPREAPPRRTQLEPEQDIRGSVPLIS